MREIDVLGKQTWKRTLKSGLQHVRLQLVVESKSAKDYHIVLSPLKTSPKDRHVNDAWLGYEGENRKRIAETLSETPLSSDQVALLLKKMGHIAYPRGIMCTGTLEVDLPPAKVSCSAFRETNIGTEKDLDNSVLWRASQSLFSAVASLKERHLKYCLDFLSDDIQMAYRIKDDPVREALVDLKVFFNFLELYHPIVIIDAPLWKTSRSDLEQVQWCRFEQLETHGRSHWWFDVVHYYHFKKFIQELTQYYERQFRKVSAQLDT